MKALFKLMLKGSVIGALAVVTATGCGDDNDNSDSGDGGDGNSGGSSAGTKTTAGSSNVAGDGSEGGTSAGGPGEGGTSTGGTTTTGGAADGGATTDGGTGPDLFGGAPNAGGADGSGGAGPSGPAVAKFCNTLTFGDDPTTMRLEVGEGDGKVTFTAPYGECVPADGAACTEIPTGAGVVVSLFDVDNDAEPLDFGPIDIVDGEQWLFYTDLTEQDLPIWSGGTLKSGFACEDITYDDI